MSTGVLVLPEPRCDGGVLFTGPHGKVGGGACGKGATATFGGIGGTVGGIAMTRKLIERSPPHPRICNRLLAAPGSW